MVSIHLFNKMNKSEQVIGQSPTGPMWNSFWDQTIIKDNVDSIMSVSERNMQSDVHSIRSMSEIGSESISPSHQIISIKIKNATNGKVFRLSIKDDSSSQLGSSLKEKLGEDVFECGLYYIDDEGDVVCICGDDDLKEALEFHQRIDGSKFVLHYGIAPEKAEQQVETVLGMRNDGRFVLYGLTAGIMFVSAIIAIRVLKM